LNVQAVWFGLGNGILASYDRLRAGKPLAVQSDLIHAKAPEYIRYKVWPGKVALSFKPALSFWFF
jgi:hypothetical protein